MAIDGLAQINVNVNSLGPQTNQSDDAAHDVIKKIIQQTGQKLDGQIQDKHQSGLANEARGASHAGVSERPSSKKFEEAFKGLLGGAAGPQGKAAAEAVSSSPIFNRAGSQAKEEFTDTTQKNPQAGFQAASGFQRVTGDARADAALNSSEAAGMVLNTYTKPDQDLKKKDNTIKEFIQSFGTADADPGVNKKALRYGLQNPQTEGQKTLYEGLSSPGGQKLQTTAKEALINLQSKNGKDTNPLKNALSLVNDPKLLKQLDAKQLSKATSILCKEGGSNATTKDLTETLKNEKFFAMSGQRRDQMLSLVGKNGTSAFAPMNNKLHDSLKSLRKDSQQGKAMRLLLESKGNLDEDEISAAVNKAKARQVPFPPFEPIDQGDPDADKKNGAQLAQWMATKQKMMQYNKKVGQRIDGAKSREELAAVDPLKSFASVIGQCKTPEELAAQPGGPTLKIAQFIFQAQEDVEKSTQGTKKKFALQRRALKKASGPLTHLKENRVDVKKTPNKTTFTLPENGPAGTANVTTSFVRMLGGTPNTASGTELTRRGTTTGTATATGGAAATVPAGGLTASGSASGTTTALPKAAPANARAMVRGWGNNTFAVGGVDREARASVKAVKPPASAKTNAADPALGDATMLSKGPALVRHGVEIRSLPNMITDGAKWNQLNSSEIAVLRNLGINRNVLESMNTPKPAIPTVFLEPYEGLKEHQKKSVVLLGITPEIWNTQATQLRDLRKGPTTHNVNNVQMKSRA